MYAKMKNIKMPLKFTPFVKFFCEFAKKFTFFSVLSAFILLNLTACSTLERYLALALQSGIISIESGTQASSNGDLSSANTAKKADKRTSAKMDTLYKAILSEVKECQSLQDKFNACAAAEYNNGKIYKILVYSKREVEIGVKTLQETQSNTLDTGLIYCEAFDEECYKMSFLESDSGQTQEFKGQNALKLIKEHFEMDMSF